MMVSSDIVRCYRPPPESSGPDRVVDGDGGRETSWNGAPSRRPDVGALRRRPVDQSTGDLPAAVGGARTRGTVRAGGRRTSAAVALPVRGRHDVSAGRPSDQPGPVHVDAGTARGQGGCFR